MGPEASDAELLEGVRIGDRDAWSVLVRRYESRLRAIGRAQGLDATAAHDVAQIVWLRLLSDPFQIHTPDALFFWLSTVARRQAIDMSKRSKRIHLEPPVEHVDDAPSPEDTTVVAEDVGALRRVFADLDEKCRELLTALYGSTELSYAEISTQLGRPIGSLGPQRMRCLEKLRALYDGLMYQRRRMPPASGREVVER